MDIESIEQLVDIIRNSKISELTVASDGAKVRLRKDLSPAPAASTPAPRAQSSKKPVAEPQTPESAEPSAKYITAPMVGIFHGNREELIGAKIRSRQTVGSIESMKLMNDILSDCDGLITEVLVEDGSAVEYGQNLFKVEPTE